jgi:hypothetical protein
VKHSDIVARTQTVWGVRNVPYSMSKTNTPTGHRADCSGYVSAVLGLPAPGENTVTLVTKGICVPISKSEMIPGDLLMIGGPGTAGAAGQYMAYRFKDVEMPLGDRYLRQGNTGGDVRDLQQLLLSLGYDLGPDGADGDFGPVTDRAVRAFQRAHSLEVDGIVGPLTLAALREATASQVPAVPAPEEPVSGPSEEFEPNVILKKLDLLLAQQAELLGRPPVTAHVDIPSLAEAIAGYLVDTPLTMADVEMALRRVLLEGVGQ